MAKKKYSVLFYITTISHLYNVDILSKSLTKYNIRIIYEKELNLISLKNFYNKNYKIYTFKNNKTPNNFFSGQVQCLYLSTALARLPSLDLIINANLKNVKIIAMQESNNFFLHNHNINNYQLPCNQLLALSAFEKKNFLKLGFNNQNVNVTGFPWNLRKKESNKDHSKKVIIALNASDINNPFSVENKSNIRLMIRNVVLACKDNYEILIKQHPTDYINNKKEFKLLLNEYKNIKIINNEINILDIINKKDVLISSGFTQIIIESLYEDVPVIIYNLENNKNVFKKFLNRMIVKNHIELKKALELPYSKKIKEFKDFKKQHMNITYSKSLNNIIKSLIQPSKIEKNNNTIINIELLIWLIFFKKDLNQNKYYNQCFIRLTKKLKLSDHNNILQSLININNNHYEFKDILNLKNHINNKLIISILDTFLLTNSAIMHSIKKNDIKKIIFNYPPTGFIHLFYKNINIIKNHLKKFDRLLFDQYCKQLEKNKSFIIYDKHVKKQFLKKLFSFSKIVNYISQNLQNK